MRARLGQRDELGLVRDGQQGAGLVAGGSHGDNAGGAAGGQATHGRERLGPGGPASWKRRVVDECSADVVQSW